MDNKEIQKLESRSYLQAIFDNFGSVIQQIIMHNPSDKNVTFYDQIEVDNDLYYIKVDGLVALDNFELKITLTKYEK